VPKPPAALVTAVLAALIVFALHTTARPPAPLITLGPQQVVQTRNPLAGVFTEEAETWKIQRGLAMVREMGAPWVIEFFPWAYYEPAEGRFEWRAADRVIDHANRQGLTVIARLGFVPGWARPAQIGGRDTTFTHVDAQVITRFARFAEAFAAHTRGRVAHIIVWNEPNLNNEWGLQRVDPAGYVEMLRAVYPAIKRGNPDAQVLAGALAPTLEKNPDVALDDLDYLRAMYAAGAQPLFDALAVHNYGATAPPDQAPAPDRINFRRVELLRQIMVEAGDAAKPVFITETGWNDHPRFVNAVTPARRIEYTLAVLDYAQANWTWVRCVGFWVFKLPAPANGYRDHFTFVTPSLAARPIYEDTRSHLEP
jgi:polysaccharide biosynthesis protein PslG